MAPACPRAGSAAKRRRAGAIAKASPTPAVPAQSASATTAEPAAAPELSAFAANDLTLKQWLYLELVEELVARGPLPSQKQMAVTLRIRPQTISEWRRQPLFRRAFMRVLQSSITVGDLVCDLANQRLAQQGSAKHYELNLRRRGLYDALPPDMPSASSHVGIVAGQVTFVGLPAPPTREQRERLNPPPGSSQILDVDGRLK
jgi:hypothetical protein